MLMAIAALLSAGCSQEEMPVPSGEDDGSGDSFAVTVGVAVPEMEAATRGVPGEKPGTGLKLTLLEFSKGADAASSFLTHVYETETLTTTDVDNGGIVKFKVTLVKTQEPKVLHLMVSDDFVSTGYGSEASLLPAISVGRRNNVAQEAYWGRVEFPNGYATAADADGNQTLLPEVKTKLTEVPVIRNFAKVSVTENLTNFELYGFELVNVPTSGTVAPFNTETAQIPQLLAADGKTMVSYDVAHAGYTGVLPPGITFANTEDVAKKWDTAEDTDKPLNRRGARYVYEHPFESTRRTYLIVKGRYNNNNNTTYYKVDLGNIGEDKMFKFYDLIRNYNYNVKITNVYANGAETVEKAINGHVSNNLSASVETSSMLQISDGKNMLFVNATSHIITRVDQKVEVRYKYIKDINNTKSVDNNAVTITGKDTSNDVIAAYSESDDGDWHVITITSKKPDAIDKRHTIRINDGNGLERVVTLLLRLPYEFASTVDVYEGAKNTRPTDKTEGIVSNNKAGEELTVYFDLPDGMPEEIFPLQFRLEANPQNVENNPTGTLVVWTGSSLFDESKPSISYMKTVTYQEYSYMYNGDTTELNVNANNTNHTIRCRLRTINQYTGTGTETTTILINNPSFKSNATATFTRKKP